MSGLSAEEKMAMVSLLSEITGSKDDVFLRSVLESSGYDFEACAAMLVEDQRAAQTLELPIKVVFEEQEYEYCMKRTDTIAALKDQIQNDTNIVPGEQMLIVASTHVEPEGSHLLGDVAGNDHLLIVHLLTPNSAA
eukprot:m.166599 g.166599  ORF g.166599 m.166599 type:complete len:136 (+) comp16438_c0_seq1:218-625(+)